MRYFLKCKKWGPGAPPQTPLLLFQPTVTTSSKDVSNAKRV